MCVALELQMCGRRCARELESGASSPDHLRSLPPRKDSLQEKETSFLAPLGGAEAGIDKQENVRA